jgi:hypothetical protein
VGSRIRQLAAATAFLGVIGALSTGSAWAASTPVTLDDEAPALQSADGGAHKVSVGLTNLTDGGLAVSATPSKTADKGCQLSVDKSVLPAAVHKSITVTAPAGCQVSDDGFDFQLHAGTGAVSKTFDVTAAPKPKADPNWDELGAFPIALLGALAFVIALFAFWRWLYWLRHLGIDVGRGGSKRKREPKDSPKLKIRGHLPGLPATYSFKDSWVSNITAIAALFTGVFASTDVVKAFIGEDAGSSLALASVGAAVALSFTSAGPIFLLSTRASENDAFTVGGLLGASVFTLTGAFGGLWVVYASGKELDLNGLEDNALPITLILVALLLALYSYRTLMATLEQGLQAPKVHPSDAALAATKIAKALEHAEAPKARPSGAAAKKPSAASKAIPEEALMFVAPGPRRSALL